MDGVTAIVIRPADLDTVESVARGILTRRQHEIVNDRLNGKHWFAAIFEEAADVVRRHSVWSRRRSLRR